MPSANEIRQQFIDFFKVKHGHTNVPSSSVVPHNDPTLLFTNAGMNQFKDVFLGVGARPYKRAVNSQKCIRAGGKHNDLEDVGRDTYHHTFFEMLGNWSFGDYYKAEAIAWAWDLLTNVWGLDKSRLHATVFGGDQEYGIDADNEAAQLWTKVTDIDPQHVHRFGKKDNFWMMGDTGPCGPCTEIHIDRTPKKTGGKLVNKGDARVMEIWNLVFIQYNRDEKGILTPLPAKHVDTGMGFERVTAVLSGKESNYDTDVFAPLMTAIGDLTGKKYQGKLEDPTDIAFRVIADHVRMLTFAITDGARPGTQKAEAVLRSVLRRAVRFGWQRFDQRDPFIYKLVPVVVGHMGEAFPELKSKPQQVADIIKSEEVDFLKTIERGLSLFDKAAQQVETTTKVIPGKQAHDLLQESGFPYDMTVQMAQERGLSVDEAGFLEAEKDHAEISRRKKTTVVQLSLNVSGLPEIDDRPKWLGSTTTGTILGWISGNEFVQKGTLTGKEDVGLLVSPTCFYAEAGGQVGDHGTIATPAGRFRVEQTQKVGSAIVHVGKLETGALSVGEQAILTVDHEREFTRKNHTATHLLHWALQSVLGEHVEQRGSKVKPDSFTFDFSHTGPVTDDEKTKLEQMVNERIYQDLPVKWRELSIDEAKKLPGVRAFFGDKYGDVVRVVEIGDGLSREFCGGTHLDHTGQAGFFKIVGEEGIAKGVRRLTAVTGREAVLTVQRQDAILGELTGRLRCKPEELPARFDSLQEEIKKLQQQLKKGASADLGSAADKLFAEAADIGGAKVIVGELPAGPDEQVRQQVDRLRQKAGSGVVVVGWATDEGKVSLIAAVSDDLVKKGLHAGKLVGQVAKVVGGAGGGKPTMAQAGGKEPAKLGEALALARKVASEQLAG